MKELKKDDITFQVTKSTHIRDEKTPFVVWYAGPKKPFFVGRFNSIEAVEDKLSSMTE